MYYNPTTQEIRTPEEVKLIVNASFPEWVEEIDGWHLIDEKMLYPHLLENQIATPTGIAFNEGKWARTYKVVNRPVEIETDDPNTASQKQYKMLEKAVMDLAQMVSNIKASIIQREMERSEQQ